MFSVLSASKPCIDYLITSIAVWVPDIMDTVELVTLSSSITSLAGACCCLFIPGCLFLSLFCCGCTTLAHVFAAAHASIACGWNSDGSMCCTVYKDLLQSQVPLLKKRSTGLDALDALDADVVLG